MQLTGGSAAVKLAAAFALGALAQKAAAVLANWLTRWAEAKSVAGKPNGKSKAEKVPIPGVQQTLSLLRERRSIFPKDYNGKGREVTEDDIRQLLEGANWAPTHKRTEPWRFVVFRGQEAIERVTDATIEGNRVAADKARGGDSFEQWHADFLKNGIEKKWRKCDVLIAICMLRQTLPDKRNPEWEEIAATACAVQNMYLMATSLGLAGYWSSWNIVGRDSDAMAKCLGISTEAGDRCLGFFCIGSSDLVGRARFGRARCGRGAVEEKTRWIAG